MNLLSHTPIAPEPSQRLVSYRRASTPQQGQSGLGLEAQAEAIAGYARKIGGTVTKEFTEIESGKRNDRPALLEAIHLAKVTGSRLVIAKLDRLSRDAAFLLTLRNTGVDFVAADIPDANSLTIGIMALVAQQEREATSKRTIEALAAAKKRGVKLGNPNGSAALQRAGKGNGASRTKSAANADGKAVDLKPILEAVLADGIRSLAGIAAEFNRRGITTLRKMKVNNQTGTAALTKACQWHPSSVWNLARRLKIALPSPLKRSARRPSTVSP